jgi:hypothetical protein
MEVSGQLNVLTALIPGKSPWYTLDRRLAPESVLTLQSIEKSLAPALAVESVARCYTD